MQKFLSFMKKHIGIWRILVIVFALIMMLGLVIGQLLEDNASQVNAKLRTRTTSYEADEDLFTLYTPDDEYNTGTDNTKNLIADHVNVGTELSQEGTVLLKNDGALPLVTSDTKAEDLKITLFGVGSSFSGAQYGMAMGGKVESSQSVSLHDALQDRGADVNDDMETYYDGNASDALAAGYHTISRSLGRYSSANAYTVYEADTNSSLMTGYTSTSMTGSQKSVGIVVISRPSTEAGDYYPGSLGVKVGNTGDTAGRSALALTSLELSEIEFAKQQCGTCVVLINTSNAIELGTLKDNENVDAMLWIGFPGNYGMYGVADVLLGNTNPSGHLADTYASNSVSAPAMQNFGIYQYASGVDTSDDHYNSYLDAYYVVEAESIYLGYKYYETRYEDSILNADSSGASATGATAGVFDSTNGWNYDEEVTYSFGYGMSYTNFKQEIDTEKGDNGLTLSEDGRTLTVYYKVTNKGSVDGRSVVQVYGQSPYYTNSGHSDIEKASVQLLNYEKTEEIPAGKSVEGSIDIDLQLLASYDTDGEGTYVMEAGDYYIALGDTYSSTDETSVEGSHAALNNILAAKGKSTTDGMDYNGDKDAVATLPWSEESEGLFSTSAEGQQVENSLDTADLNHYLGDDYVTYLSRTDWTWGNGWQTPAMTTDNDGNVVSGMGYTGVQANSDMTKQLMNDTYVQDTSKTGQVTFDADNGLTLYDMIKKDDNGDPIVEDGVVQIYDFDDTDENGDVIWDKLMDELNLQEGINFICEGNRQYAALSGINFVGGTITENGPSGITLQLDGNADAPWLDYDNDGYYMYDMGCATLQAAAFNQDLLEEIGELWGNDSLFLMLPVLWAPSLNIHRTPYNGRTAEYYSEDSAVSGYSALSICKGGQTKGLVGTIKHFAFNDQETDRNGLSVYLSEQQARENELRGFQIAFEGGAKATMTSFNRVGCTYSGASTAMSKILRGEWQYQGYAVSDYFFSGNYMRFDTSVLAGTTNYDALASDLSSWGDQVIASTYANNPEMQLAVRTAVQRALWTFVQSNMMNYMTPTAHLVNVNNWWRTTYTLLEVVGGVVAGLALVAFVIGAVDEVITKKED